MALDTKKIGSITRLLQQSFRTYLYAFALMVVLGLISGLLEGIGIATVIPLFAVLTNQAIEGAGRISQLIAWIFHTAHLPLSAPFILSFSVCLFIIKAFVQFWIRYFNARTVATFEEQTRKSLVRRTLQADWSFLLRQKAGYLDSILLYDVEMNSAIINTIASIITTGTTFLAYTVIAFSLSIKITAITLAVGGALFWSFNPIYYRIRKRLTEAAMVQKDLNHHIAEHMASVKSIKATAIEQPVLDYASGLFARLRQAKIDTARFRQAALAVVEPIGFVLIAFVFLFSYHRAGFSVASFAVIMYLIQQMFGYVSSISGQFQMVNQLYPYLVTTSDWRRRAGAHREIDQGTEPFSFRRAISFDHVAFSYSDDKSIFQDFSLTIPQGQLVGIAGPSGVGKTTVADLLIRLFTPQSGKILVDGTDITQIKLNDWRDHIGYVPQDALLLNASVRDNIRFYSDVTDADIEAAARAANIHDMISELPLGYGAPVGERGVHFSGGQRQRIILARALAREPDILILDEATSAIDTESEKLIHESIAALRGKTTIIVITHRLSTAQHLDRLVVLEDGKILEDGTPEQLMAKSDSYLARLLAHQ